MPGAPRMMVRLLVLKTIRPEVLAISSRLKPSAARYRGAAPNPAYENCDLAGSAGLTPVNWPATGRLGHRRVEGRIGPPVAERMESHNGVRVRDGGVPLVLAGKRNRQDRVIAGDQEAAGH